jgi:hypothetical protein
MANKNLIDPNEFWDRLNKASYDVITYPDREMDSPQFGYYTDTIQAVLNQTKKVDAVEVVRCKDCKFPMKNDMCDEYWCNGSRVPGNWYCADGEREDNA